MLAISAVRVGKTERPVTQGVRSLEVRWIFPGQMETAVAEWFGRFPAMTQSREGPVRKRRRISRFALASRPVVAPAPGRGQEPRSAVELTEIRAHGQDWWTLGFEAAGPAHLLSSELQAAAALVFAQPLPGGVQPGPDESQSYAGWLHQPGATTQSSPGPGEVSRRSR
jgi:hypothetical protein